MEYYISIDGGGTQTEMVIYNNECKMEKRIVCGSTNINQVGTFQFNEVMDRITEIITNYPGGCVYIGIPGYGDSSKLDNYVDYYFHQALSLANFEYKIINDAVMANYASLGNIPGITMISGTGSMCISTLGTRVQSIGGWGYLIGDEGSAFAIGKDAISHVSKVFDGLNEESLLSQLICREHKFDFKSKLLNYVYLSPNYRVAVAAIAPLVDKAATAGCPTACEILDTAIDQMVCQVQKLISSTEDNVSFSGGVFNSEYVRKGLINKLDLCCNLSQPVMPSVLGGISRLLLEQELAIDIDILIKEYDKYINK